MLCSQCEVKEPYEPSAWFEHIWFLYQLQRGGFPFEADDLDLIEWIDLGIMRAELEAISMKGVF